MNGTEKNNFPDDFPNFPELVGTKFCQKFAIHKQFKKRTEKVHFKHQKDSGIIQGIQESVTTMSFKT